MVSPAANTVTATASSHHGIGCDGRWISTPAAIAPALLRASELQSTRCQRRERVERGGEREHPDAVRQEVATRDSIEHLLCDALTPRDQLLPTVTRLPHGCMWCPAHLRVNFRGADPGGLPSEKVHLPGPGRASNT